MTRTGREKLRRTAELTGVPLEDLNTKPSGTRP